MGSAILGTDQPSLILSREVRGGRREHGLLLASGPGRRRQLGHPRDRGADHPAGLCHPRGRTREPRGHDQEAAEAGGGLEGRGHALTVPGPADCEPLGAEGRKSTAADSGLCRPGDLEGARALEVGDDGTPTADS